MKKGRIIAGAAVVAVLAAVGGGIAYSQQAAIPTVHAATVATQNLTVTVTAPGTVQAGSSRSVYAPVAGTLAKVAVTDGQAVKAGDVLATLDDTSLKTALAQAEAQASAADAQARSADAQLAQARALPDDTDAQERARNASISAARAAQEAAAASRAAADVALRAAQDASKKTTIVAPSAGTVTFPVLAITSMDGTGPKAAAGASVSPAVPLFTITDLGRLVFAAQVDEGDVGRVAAGQSAHITLDAYPGTDFTGKVSEVATSSITTKTGGIAYVVKVPLAANDAHLRLGMSGDISLATASVADALVVPAEAIVAEGGARYVYKVTGGTVAKTEVKLGASTDTLAQVTSGLAAGDKVATTGVTGLADGAKVNVSA